MPLTHDQERRYARHLIMPQIGRAGQERLLASRVLVIGAGGLGSPVLTYLAACGVGTLGVMDDDVVERSNLNRQILHETADIGRAKVFSAEDRITELNPDCTVHPYKRIFDAHAADELLPNYDLVIDGTDSFATRYIINHACCRHQMPWIHGAVRGMEGYITRFNPAHADAPCYQCFVPHPPREHEQDCQTRGVLGAVVGVIGTMMAVEAIKTLLQITPHEIGILHRYDGLSGIWKRSHILRDPECMECGTHSTVTDFAKLRG
ncbi:MAG: HesA/MoeB/ThiF family protein [Alphaproteobacteria bacterium]|nr:MAG: HesA/MoeB/ThiF family protein [Alphaproteobacteria bacterium]TAF14293.1 MAG: HesA/MoeB/ThiF family protein [Alphaproteobacteria bacterium]TAF40441.1 MAG: HesA/MoeB/ThiF family protein [Alphaproteobacteria bacterium]TAF76481.1 MAG: HesA/MoeB/ThiF family protein [Alphaproteobacteria bacterium]